MRKRLFYYQGFSLIELMVVAIITAVLVMIAVPLYLRQAEQAMGSKALENLNNMFNAEMLYMPDNETFTTDMAVLQSYAWFETNDGDWQYNVDNAGDQTFQLSATRINSSFVGTITMDDKTNIVGLPWPPP